MILELSGHLFKGGFCFNLLFLTVVKNKESNWRKKMNRKLIFFLFIGLFVFQNAFAGQKWGENASKTYTNEDGSIYSVSVNLSKNSYAGANGGGKDTENNSIGNTHETLNIVSYDQSGEIVAQNYYYPSRVTYVADSNDNIVGIKSCWSCPIVETFKYTDSGKMLVYGADGHLKGTYDSLLDYHATNPLGKDSYNGIPNGKGQYIDHTLNLISEDGNFYDYDEKGKLQGVYYSDGKSQTYKYSSNGDYALYDSDGNFLGNFMSNGQKRRIYSVNEAVAITTKGPKNRFIIKYR